METAPLKSFATWARTALIREVTARIAVVLAPASPERVEQPNAVAALEKAVKVAGGGEAGRVALADKVAYTWFNRIIALRFMDANGYTGIGVVSPERGRDGGQPEVLAEAKRGNIDSAVVTNTRTVEAVTSLLNGTRRSDDPQGEAYALLLAEHCRHWNRSMPFMFELEGDFTELLIPANLLADDSVLARAMAVLTEEVCQDVEVIGWLYQFYISERKDEVFAGFKKNMKAGAAEIPAATQLFTPDWIVRYLVENSLGRLWLLNRPTSHLADQMDYYIAPVEEETDYLKVASPEELKIIDPACGSGHMLTYAFDLLYAIYEEEGYAPSDIPGLILTHNLYGTEIDPRAGTLAAFALTMKARARQRTLFNKKTQPKICVLEPIEFTPVELDKLVTPGGDRAAEESFWNQFQNADTFGALIRPREDLIGSLSAHLDTDPSQSGDLFQNDLHERARHVLQQATYLSAGYYIVVTNPPYMGSGNMDATLTEWLKENYPDGKQDVYGAFVSRAILLTIVGGLVAMITGDSWMTIKGFAELRKGLLRNHAFLNFLHLYDVSYHADVFGANAAFIVSERSANPQACMFVRLEPLSSENKRQRLLEAVRNPHSPWAYRVQTEEFEAVPGASFVYCLTDAERQAFESGVLLSDVIEFREGINTGDNDRFLRRWWEVERRSTALDTKQGERAVHRWVPIKKGGAYRKWAGNHEYVVNWADDGREIRTFTGPDGRLRSRPQNTQFFFQPSASWGRISSGDFSIRYYGQGFAFDSTGPSAFGDEKNLSFALAFLNSALAKRLLGALSPTLDFRLGNMGNLPVPSSYGTFDVSHVQELVGIAQSDWDRQETSWSFSNNPLNALGGASLASAWHTRRAEWATEVERCRQLENSNNAEIAELYNLADGDLTVPRSRIALGVNPEYRFPSVSSGAEREKRLLEGAVGDLVSYAIGCMFGRYSLDEPGLIMADQGETVQDYLSRVPEPSFAPDVDNVIPIIDGEWFEDDIVARFRQFLRVAFGEQHFEENLRFVTEALGVKDLRDYFVRSFYKDHVQRYKKRPIYWLFSSPKGSFNALVYMHRYTPTTVSTVLNEYLREFRAKLEASRQHHERLAAGGGTPRQLAAAQKEVDRLRKVLLELDEYEHDVLYPLATQQVQIDLDDGVKANYPKFGAALKKIPGLEVSDE